MTLRKQIKRLESDLVIAQLHVDAEVNEYYSNVKVIAPLRCRVKFK